MRLEARLFKRMPSLLVKSTSCGEKLGTSFLRSSDVESRPLLGKQKKPSPSTPSVPCRHDKAKGSTSFFVLVCRRFAVTLFLFVTLLMISKIQQGHIHQKRGGSQDNITHHLPSQDQISSRMSLPARSDPSHRYEMSYICFIVFSQQNRID